jgi:hypothetical protein
MGFLSVLWAEMRVNIDNKKISPRFGISSKPRLLKYVKNFAIVLKTSLPFNQQLDSQITIFELKFTLRDLTDLRFGFTFCIVLVMTDLDASNAVCRRQ